MKDVLQPTGLAGPTTGLGGGVGRRSAADFLQAVEAKDETQFQRERAAWTSCRRSGSIWARWKQIPSEKLCSNHSY